MVQIVGKYAKEAAAMKKRKRRETEVRFASVSELVSEIYELGEGLVKNVQLIEDAQN